MPPTGRSINTPALAGSVLSPDVPNEERVVQEVHSSYRTGIGKLLDVARWSRPETWNAVRELTRTVKGSNMMHYNAMLRVMRYSVDTPERGWSLNPTRTWDRKSKFEFRISGRSDSDYAKCPASRRSVSGHNIKLKGAVIICKSGIQKTTTLSVTESEIVSGVTCAEDMMYAKNIVESIGLKVELPMRLITWERSIWPKNVRPVVEQNIWKFTRERNFGCEVDQRSGQRDGYPDEKRKWSIV